ncbi:MAG: helix-turn-helix transcriptional regulator [Pseudomonadota bacterium]|nr:helix-turn-helix transcriptional regulator [Pseudomonadota bacterium]
MTPTPFAPFALLHGTRAVKNSDQEIGENLDAGLKCVGLTSREIQILRHIALGKGDKRISVDLQISVKTVNHHVSNIMLKLGATNRTHAVAKALLTMQIEMRATDAPAGAFNRRPGDQDKMVRVVTNNVPVSMGCQMPGHGEESLPRQPHEDQI